MKKPIFAGAGVAIVTPFKDETLKINFPLFSYNVSIAKKPLLQYTFFDTITYENTLY